MTDWTGSEKQRKPQAGCECPPDYRGSARYVSQDECKLPTKMPFGKFKGKPIDSVGTDYLEWFLEIVKHTKIREAVHNELARRKEKHHERTAS
jgi:hypothetical protein